MKPNDSITDFFAPERQTTVNDFDHALEVSSEYEYFRRELSLDQIFLDTDLTLGIHGDSYRLTEPAFESLCAVVKIPISFARQIPSDLVAVIVDRLKRLHQQSVVVVHRADVVVGLVDPQRWSRSGTSTHRPHYTPINNLRMLQMVKGLRSDSDKAARITLADSGISVELTSPDLAVEPLPGDLTRVGMLVTSSETGGPMPSARGYTLRLVCSNGAVAPSDFGNVYFSTDWRVALESRLRRFEGELARFQVDMKVLSDSYRILSTARLSDTLFVNLYRQALYVFRSGGDSQSQADRVLGVEPGVRSQLVKQVRARQLRLRANPNDRADREPPATDLAAWDVFNSVTAAAKGQSPRRRLALEKLGGDLIGAFTRNRAIQGDASDRTEPAPAALGRDSR